MAQGGQIERLLMHPNHLPGGHLGVYALYCQSAEIKVVGHVVRHDTLPKTILQGYVECGERRDKLKKKLGY